MIPNNNFSVLPWYTSLDQQNARRWWLYDRVYPLFTPATFLLPFQLMRENETTEEYSKGAEIAYYQFEQGSDIAIEDGIPPHLNFIRADDDDAALYNISGKQYVYIETLPEARNVPAGYSRANVVFLDNEDNVLTFYDLVPNTLEGFTGGIAVPNGAVWMWVQKKVDDEVFTASIYNCTAQIISTPVSSFKIYTRAGELVGDYPSVRDAIEIVTFDGYDYLVYTGLLPFAASFENGQYYAVLVSGEHTWYSEVFTVVNNIAPYLKIVWWDNEDFVMDAGRIVYCNPNFKNVLYLDAQIAKPEYVFEEEGESRDGYFFPTKQISEKRYRFAFLASEYLLDVMRFIRMADFAYIESNGQRYSLDTFLITPEWESNGDVAAVSAEFDTATVAKKIGVGYVKALRGDFNDDFNNDFINQ